MERALKTCRLLILLSVVILSISCVLAVPQVRGLSEPVVYRGFAVHSYQLIYGWFRIEHFNKIRQWGFNSVLVEFWWSKDFEPSKSAVGVYNEQNLRKFRSAVDLARQAGLVVIISGRVCYDPSVTADWDGWATHDYVNLNLSGGLTRYARFWEMMVQRFPDCIYCLWHMPYHKQGVDSTRANKYYQTTFPTLLNAVRKYSSNKVVFVPIHQGSESSYYKTAMPLRDSNIIYGLGHMSPGKVEYDSNTWDYDYADLTSIFAGVKRWRETFNLPMMSVEYFPLEWIRGRSIAQSRLDALEESLKRMQLYNVGWMYWRLSLEGGGDNILANTASFEPNQSILTRLQRALGVTNTNTVGPTAVPSTSRYFDFGTSSSPVEAGHTRVSSSTGYSASLGYGWSSTVGLSSRDRGAPDNLRRDFVQSSGDHTFSVDLPNGNYQLILVIGDHSYRHDFIDTYAEGILRVNDLTVASGLFGGVLFVVTVADGQLNIRFHDDGGSDANWVINAITIKPQQ